MHLSMCANQVCRVCCKQTERCDRVSNMADGAGAGGAAADLVKLALPKGRMKENVFDLLKEAGISVKLSNERTYRPSFGLDGVLCAAPSCKEVH